MRRESRASLIAIGTEITSGEILNSNVKWLAERLEALGFEVVLHLAVPDDRPMIVEALNYAQKQSGLVFVTGGLGPTSDDFTREVMAEWSNDTLEFRQEAWDFLEEISRERGLKLREAHKQQCQFPTRSETIKNRAGTAHGFYLVKEKTHCFVLPGPPLEIDSIWEPSVLPRLESLKPKESMSLYRWVTFGAPESEVAEVVEECLEGSGCKVGYRASLPYVHVKVWTPPGTDSKSILDKVQSKLQGWIAFEGEDILEEWLKDFSKFKSIEILDEVTEGLLAQRFSLISVQNYIDDLRLHTSWSQTSQKAVGATTTSLLLSAQKNSDGQFIFSIVDEAKEKNLKVQLPFRLKAGTSRAKTFLVEQALVSWRNLLK